jgi:hypothetical protein
VVEDIENQLDRSCEKIKYYSKLNSYTQLKEERLTELVTFGVGTAFKAMLLKGR